jgi:N-acetylmuramoyl-L-alanine amidase
MNITEKFLSINKYSRSGGKIRGVQAFVIHWTATPGQGANGVWTYYETDEASIQRYGSAHYIIDLDGDILQAIPETEAAWHVGSSIADPQSGKVYTDLARKLFPDYCEPKTTSPNWVTLGVECCVINKAGEFSPETYKAAVELSQEVCNRYSLGPDRLIRHYDVVGWKKCPLYYVENSDKWAKFTTDVFGPTAFTTN